MPKCTVERIEFGKLGRHAVEAKNERAAILTRLEANGAPLLLVPVAAALVASIQLDFLDAPLHLRYSGPNLIACDAGFRKGAQMGWFQHDSTIIVFAPCAFALCDGIREGPRVRVGERLMRLPQGRGRFFL